MSSRASMMLAYPDKPFIEKLSKDLKDASKTLSPMEARYLVDTYYQVQEHRIATAAQARTLEEADEPSLLVNYLAGQLEMLEKEIQNALKAYAGANEAGAWAMSICGIGPVLAAGLLAHIDPDKFNYVGSIFKFGGWSPDSKWEKGEKRPWNAGLKVLFWKIGESFVKVSNNPNDFYGKHYQKWKAIYQHRNEQGEYKQLAEEKKSKVGKSTEAFKHLSKGALPPGHIQLRAQRKAAQLFLAHFAQVLWESHHKKPFAQPWVVTYGGHSPDSVISPPGWNKF